MSTDEHNEHTTWTYLKHPLNYEIRVRLFTTTVVLQHFIAKYGKDASYSKLAALMLFLLLEHKDDIVVTTPSMPA